MNMPTRKFPISNPTASNGLPELNPGHVQGSRPIKLLGRGRTGIKHQSRTTAGGGARRPMRETGLKVYRRSVVVKASYRRSWSKIPWKAHARYLTREHAQTEHERGIGFDAGHDQVDMIGIVDRWQKEGTPLMWRVIISPDDHDRIDLREHIREVVAGMERDLGTKLEWTAIDHHPADHHDHVHLLIRGIRDDGKELILDRDYVTHGIKELSQSIIERDLGPRLEHEMLIARERGIHANYWTAIDAALQRRANDSGHRIRRNALHTRSPRPPAPGSRTAGLPRKHRPRPQSR